MLLISPALVWREAFGGAQIFPAKQVLEKSKISLFLHI